MRYIWLFLVSVLMMQCVSQKTVKDKPAVMDKTVFTVSNTPVYADEFLYSYQKNLPSYDTITVEEDVKDYLDLYIKFKLKVYAARDAGYDTVKAYLEEFNGYKKQLAKPYLTETKIREQQKKMHYERMLEMVNSSHILLQLTSNPSSLDTLAAYNKINAIRDSIVTGTFSFNEAAVKYSQDPSARMNEGDLGYFAAFSLVGPYEDAAYETPIGEVSDVVRTSFGYHLVKVTDRKMIPEKMELSHVYVSTQNRDDSAAYKKIDEAYRALESGMPWDSVCVKFSEDPQSSTKGGTLGEVQYNLIDGTFYTLASLQDEGVYSEPFQTRYGWHIAKPEKKIPFPPYKDYEAKVAMKMSSGGRNTSTADAVEAIKKRNNFEEFEQNKSIAFSMVEPSVLEGKWRFSAGAEIGDKPVFILGGQNYTITDFLSYIETNQRLVKGRKLEDYLQDQYNKYQEDRLFDFEIYTIMQENDDFRFLLNEYREGILLFEIMEDSVWNKAVSDSSGLEAFFGQNRNKYYWEEHATGFVVKTKDEAIYNQLRELLKADQLDSAQNLLKTKKGVRFTEGPFEKGMNEWIDQSSWETGLYTFSDDEEYIITLIQSIDPPRQKELHETRGQVISDYQNEIENIWVEKLKSRYSVNINDEVVTDIIGYIEP